MRLARFITGRSRRCWVSSDKATLEYKYSGREEDLPYPHLWPETDQNECPRREPVTQPVHNSLTVRLASYTNALAWP